MTPTDRDHDLLTALGHPLRRRILREMGDGETISPRELSNTLRRPLTNVSYHVRVLTKCGAVTLVKAEPVRGSVQHYYRSTVDAPWARQVLGLGEDEGGAAGNSADAAST